MVVRHFEKISGDEAEKLNGGKAPGVWKTIGDEIVLCCRLKTREHLAFCVRAFVTALRTYGEHLDASGKHLDVKGYGWVAAFPSPNVSVEVYKRTDTVTPDGSTSDIPVEYVEIAADKDPSGFDFLGKEIDSGFRTGRFCTSDSLMMSLELAYLVARAAQDQMLREFRFSYSGRQPLKGVLDDRPYPLISIDAERSVPRQRVRDSERSVIGHHHQPSPHEITTFLQHFFVDEGVEVPILLGFGEQGPAEKLPASYIDFKINWEAQVKELSKRAESEASAEREDADSSVADLPAAVDDAFKELFRTL